MLNNHKYKLNISLIAIGIISASTMAYAEQASSKLTSVLLDDGSKINIRKWGDEFSHGWETEAGYSVIQDKKSGVWYYAAHDRDGSLIKSTRKVNAQDVMAQPKTKLRNTPNNTTASLSKHVRLTGEAYAKAQLRRKNAHSTNLFASGRANVNGEGGKTTSATSNATVVQGRIDVPVMLLNFADTSTATTRDDFDQFLFKDAKGLTAYYDEVSYGMLDIQGGSSGVIDWVKLPQTHDFYGQNNRSGYDANIGVMIEDALNIADVHVDFSQYADVNQDCSVDLISFVYQGNGEHQAVGRGDDIWAHKYSLYWLETEGDGNGEYVTNDACPSDPTKNMVINDYFVAPELSEAGTRAHVGTFAHEFGHVFGLPDLYDTNGSTWGQNAGAGDWSLMASGSKVGPNRDGESPAHISAWGKYTLGWISPQKINDINATNVNLSESSGNAQALIYENPANAQEYFIIENRNQRGFDAFTPGTGIAIWHIDDDIAAPGPDGSTQSNVNAVSCDFGFHDCSTSHNGVALVAADFYFDLEHDFNDGDTHDLFGEDGDGGADEYGSLVDEDTEFSGEGQVTSNWWDNTVSGLTIKNISTKGDVMSFDLGNSGTEPIEAIELVNDSHEIIAAVEGEEIRAFINVPEDASNLRISIEHNSGGDADLYVNFGSYSSESDADCFLNSGSSKEVCDESEFGATRAGTYYAVIKGYNNSAFNNVSLRARYETSGASDGTHEFVVNVGSSEYQHFQIEVPEGANSIEAVLDKNGGAAMLMINEGTPASGRIYDDKDNSGNSVRVDNPAANTWHIAVRGRNGGIINGLLTVTVR